MLTLILLPKEREYFVYHQIEKNKRTPETVLIIYFFFGLKLVFDDKI